MTDIPSLHRAQDHALSSAHQLVGEGRGIVTSLYDGAMPSGWVLLNELKRLTGLPIEIWARPEELSTRNREIISSLGLDITFRDLPLHIRGFVSKPAAIVRSRFEEVLWIDCDNAPIRDPAFLFDDPEYRQKGSLFWRDVSGADRSNTWCSQSPVWNLFRVVPNDAEEFDTGQLLINRTRLSRELALIAHFNEGSEVYYDYLNGDKDTFRLAFQQIQSTTGVRSRNYLEGEVPYGFMPFGPFHMGKANPWKKWGGGSVMVQRDREGKALFNHRTIYKLSLNEENVFNHDIENEPLYHSYIEGLRNANK